MVVCTNSINITKVTYASLCILDHMEHLAAPPELAKSYDEHVDCDGQHYSASVQKQHYVFQSNIVFPTPTSLYCCSQLFAPKIRISIIIAIISNLPVTFKPVAMFCRTISAKLLSDKFFFSNAGRNFRL